jgi:hypothetical protein
MRQLEDLLQDCAVKLSTPGQMGWGTGFFVAPGLILTCAHVVKGSVQVCWQERILEAVVERSLPDPYDLALLRVSLTTDVNPPCVLLAEEVRSRDPLYLFGYPDEGDCNGEPRTFNCDGTTGNEVAAILFNLGQVRPGMSGSPLLNQRTGKVCGVVKFTRDRSIDLGGGAIPTHVILEQFPQLQELQREFHEEDRRWSDLLITQLSEIDFQPYLQSILDDEDYLNRRKCYISSTVKGCKQILHKQTEQLGVLEGLRKYAAEHVLLVGKPGSGKSTALQQMLQEEAQKALVIIANNRGDFKIPVLIELRDRKEEAIVNRIHEKLRRRTGLAIKTVEELLLEGRFLLLFDGLNEIPTSMIWSILREFQDESDFRKNSRIFSTRELGNDIGLGLLKKLTMLPLTESQKRTFIQSRLDERAEILLGQLKDRLRELAETPLLLKMLCDVAAESLDRDLPANRGMLFRQEFARRYQAFKSKRGCVSEDSRRLTERLLQQLALEMTQGYSIKNLKLQLSKDQAIQILQVFLKTQGETNTLTKASEYLDDLLNWDLLQLASDETQIEFHHQLFQEYYVAEAFLNGQQKIADLVAHIYEPHWQEIILLVVELQDNSDDLVRLIKARLDIFFAEQNKSRQLQQLLTWANQKASYIGVSDNYQNLNGASSLSYKRFQASIRAFYCANSLTYALDLNRTSQRIGVSANELLGSLNSSLSLDLVFAAALDHKNLSNLNYYLVRDRALVSIIDFAHDLNQKISQDPNFYLASLFIHTLASLLNDILTNNLIPWDLDSDLEASLWLLKTELSDLNNNRLDQWSHKLRCVLNNHQVIFGEVVNFPEDEVEKVESFLRINQLLVECLNRAFCLTHSLKEEILSTLLLSE